MIPLSKFIKGNYRTIFSVSVLSLIFYLSIHQNYQLFHTIVELFSIVVAFAVFIVTWNSRKMQDNHYLYLVGIAYIFIGALDLMHTLTFKGMHLVAGPEFFANQFWVATRFLEALTFVVGFKFISSRRRFNADLIFLSYFLVSLLIFLSVMVWRIFPVCFIEGVGQTPFKVYAEYTIIALLLLATYLLAKNKHHFSQPVYRLLLASMVFTIISEFCFTLYVSNFSTVNELGHYAKLIAFFLIYKANVETGFLNPTATIFRNLKENEEKYRTLAENMPGLILRIDQDLNCIYANSAAGQFILNGKSLSQIDNKNEVVSSTLATHNGFSQLLNQVKLTKQPQDTTITQGNAGQQHIYAIQVIPEFADDDTEETYLVIGQDITRQKMAEQQMKELNATKDKLFSIIAHDLKNPFTSLLSFSELMYKNAERLPKEKIEHMALRMNESAKQAYTLLENLLEWSRVQTGILKPLPQFIPVTNLLTTIEEFAAPLAQAKGITINITAVADQLVYADPQMALTILRNLVSNAIKFSYPNSTVTVNTEKQARHVLFAVSDSGIGIAKENQQQLLQIGNTFSTSGTASEKGTGLGLVLCREFVEMNGGTIWLESDFGMGTTFYFTLPVGY